MFLAGETITAGRLNRLQPKKYVCYQDSALTGAVTLTLVPGCTMTVVTETAGALWTAWWAADFDLTGAQTGNQLARARVDGVVASRFASFAAEVSTDRGSTGNVSTGTLATPGSHTFELVATLTSNASINAQSALLVEITEVV